MWDAKDHILRCALLLDLAVDGEMESYVRYGSDFGFRNEWSV